MLNPQSGLGLEPRNSSPTEQAPQTKKVGSIFFLRYAWDNCFCSNRESLLRFYYPMEQDRKRERLDLSRGRATGEPIS